MEEECDYMSDDLVKLCGDDVRPGLIHSRIKQREHTVAEKKKKKDHENKRNNTPLRVKAAQLLNEGLQQPLGPENKGFSMMQKMGFNPGSSLGVNNTGILEPILITLKNDRGGLGKDQIFKNLKLKKELSEKDKSAPFNVTDFRAQAFKKSRERRIISDLLKSEKICYQLDTENSITNPVEPWFWPANSDNSSQEEDSTIDDCKHDLPKGESNDVDDKQSSEYEIDEKLEVLTSYLRSNYCYCIWCGVKYEDEKDLSSSCPGSTREDH